MFKSTYKHILCCIYLTIGATLICITISKAEKTLRVKHSNEFVKNVIKANDFDTIPSTNSSDNYELNCVNVLIISMPENTNISNIVITLYYLDINVKDGEYFLIGAGIKPFGGPDPLMVSNGNKTRKYFVNRENAYVAFVSSNTSSENNAGFKMAWEFQEDNIEIVEKLIEVRNDDVLQSVPLCIFNTSAAVREFNQSEDIFQAFREKLAMVATQKFRQNEKSISARKVEIYRISAVIPGNGNIEILKDGALYVMVKIVGDEKGQAEFRRHELQEVVDYYDKQYSGVEMNGYKIGKCVKTASKSSTAYVGFYLIVPAFLIISIIIWTWDRNPLSKYFKEDTYKRPAFQNAQVSENEYVSTVPKFIAADDQGRRQTLFDIHNSPEDVIFSGLDFHSRRDPFNRMTHDQTLQQNTEETMVMKPYGIVNYSFENTEHIPELVDDDDEINNEQGLEHLYDSVEPYETRSTEETKL